MNISPQVVVHRQNMCNFQGFLEDGNQQQILKNKELTQTNYPKLGEGRLVFQTPRVASIHFRSITLTPPASPSSPTPPPS